MIKCDRKQITFLAIKMTSLWFTHCQMYHLRGQNNSILMNRYPHLIMETSRIICCIDSHCCVKIHFDEIFAQLSNFVNNCLSFLLLQIWHLKDSSCFNWHRLSVYTLDRIFQNDVACQSKNCIQSIKH